MKTSNQSKLNVQLAIWDGQGKILNESSEYGKNPKRLGNSDVLFDNANRVSGWLSTVEAAKYLSISPGQLRNITSNGKVVYYKLGRSNRYLASDLDRLLLKERRGPNGN